MIKLDVISLTFGRISSTIAHKRGEEIQCDKRHKRKRDSSDMDTYRLFVTGTRSSLYRASHVTWQQNCI